MPNQYTFVPTRKPIFVIGPSIAYIPLTQGQMALVDADDAEELASFNWCAHLSRNRVYYVQRSMKVDGGQKYQSMHGFLLPEASEVDHKNRNPLDNRRANLRPATTSENAMNRGLRKDNRSGVKGVNFQCNKWHASIRFKGKTKHLGHYASFQDAVSARKIAEAEFHGEFAN